MKQMSMLGYVRCSENDAGNASERDKTTNTMREFN